MLTPAEEAISLHAKGLRFSRRRSTQGRVHDINSRSDKRSDLRGEQVYKALGGQARRFWFEGVFIFG